MGWSLEENLIDLTELKCSMSLDDLKMGISRLYEEVNRREEMKVLGNLTAGGLAGVQQESPSSLAPTTSTNNKASEELTRNFQQMIDA